MRVLFLCSCVCVYVCERLVIKTSFVASCLQANWLVNDGVCYVCQCVWTCKVLLRIPRVRFRAYPVGGYIE